jgi:hypothetical protein
MSKTATINPTKAKQLTIKLEKLDELKRQVLLLLPDGALPYGSKLWWEKEELEADRDIKAGRVKKFKSAQDAIKWLNS